MTPVFTFPRPLFHLSRWSEKRGPLQESHRHHRKYIEGQLAPERCFYFQGKDKHLNLRAQNLMIFLQLAEGVDDETWEYHLQRGDYEKWFRDSIKDEGLAANAKRLAELPNVDPDESRRFMREMIEKDYTLPASKPVPVAGAQ